MCIYSVSSSLLTNYFRVSGLQDVSLGLGLNSGTSGRRDSFDRNTSAFSPSVEYARPKWPQTHQPYGALGNLSDLHLMALVTTLTMFELFSSNLCCINWAPSTEYVAQRICMWLWISEIRGQVNA